MQLRFNLLHLSGWHFRALLWDICLVADIEWLIPFHRFEVIFSQNLVAQEKSWLVRQDFLGPSFVSNALSAAWNSMTSSERPSPEPILKKEASPAVLRERERERILEVRWKPQMP